MMKKIIFILILTMFCSGTTQFVNAQLMGKWVLPIADAEYGSIHYTFLLTFYQNGIQHEVLPVALPQYNAFCDIAAGGYTQNYDLEFYILNEKFCYGNQSFIWNSADDFAPECQIINRPGYSDRYYLFYIAFEYSDVMDELFLYNEIWYANNVWHVSPNNYIFGGTFEMIAFAISDVVNGVQYLYASTGDNFQPPNQIVAGLKRWPLTSNGVNPDDMEIVFDQSGSNFVEEDFFSYNMEIKTTDDDDFVIAWISESSGSNNKVFVYMNGNGYIYDLDLGRIGGIEFSGIDEDILYVSCPQSGIVALYYTTGQVVQQVTPDNDYGRSFLQHAPDGHIYAVSNYGSALGRIDKQTGNFTPEVLIISYPYNLGNIFSTCRIFNDEKYFILPENGRTFEPLALVIDSSFVSCPGDCDGEATAQASGGTPPYTYEWFDQGISIGTGDEIYDLCEGEYTCCVTDALEFVFCESFEIIVDPNLFTDLTWWNVSTTVSPSNLNKSFKEGIRISNNAVLTLTDCYMEFGKDAKVIIEPGSELVLDNSVLTNLDACPDMWLGVQVWGNAGSSQYINPVNGIQWQGKLVMRDSAMIEHAVIAVDLWENGNYNKTGGIVQANDAIFRNNGRAVHALYYYNFNPVNPSQVMDNISYFKYCTFEITGNYIPDVDFYKHVDMAHVDGIKFKACDFTLQAGVNGVNTYNQAIAAYSAGFDVEAVCTVPGQIPCTNYDGCSFAGFNRGIYAANTSTTNTFTVNRADFNNNATGIYASLVNNLSVLFSNFNVGKNAADEGECESEGQKASGYGIDMTGCTGFAIEENYFTPGITGGYFTGIRIAETEATDEVYKNYFDGLSYGNYAVGKNWKLNYTWQGLAYYCNENTGNWEDFTVANIPGQSDGIQDPIGSVEMPAGNTFSTNANYNINNDGDYWIGYYYYAPTPGNTSTVYYPGKVYRVTREVVVDIQNECPSHYGGGGSGGESGRGMVLTPEERQQAEQDFALNLTDYNNVKALYDNLKDGGNTDATLSDVEIAWPTDMWELRAELLGKSPHLSMDVLKAVADKTEVLPESVIFEIMAANPDELKKEELIEYLEDKKNPLPDYMIDILKQVAMGTTYKTVLHRQMAHYNKLTTRAAHDIIRSILNDSIVDYAELRNWLDNVGGKRADEQIIATYMQEGNTADAMALANMMPALYGFEGDELTEHNYYTEILNLQITLKNEGRTIFDFDSTELNNLVSIADNSSGTAGTQAKGILEFAYGYHYCNCIDADTSGYKSSGSINFDAFNQVFGPKIEVRPNPASEWTSFNYTLPDNEAEGIIKISDVTGKVFETFIVSGQQGQKVWDTRKVKKGVYLYTFTVNGLSKSGKIVITK